MNPRDKHMLEVFQGLGDADVEKPPQKPPAPPPSEPPGPPPPPRAPGPRGLPELPPRGVWIAALLFTFLAGLLVGRVTAPAPEVRAERGGGAPERDPLAFLDESSAQEPAPASGVGSSRRVEGEEDVFADMRRALLDPENRYTVLAITYDLNPANRKLAVATARHFVERGLPVCEPYERGDLLYIMVGAAPRGGDLEALVEDVRGELDPAGREDQYRSAYVERIDTIVTGRR